jgi:hypothetical protein
MKKIITAVALLIAISGNTQSARYTEAMQKNLALLDSAKTAASLQALGAAFERIGDAEKTQWLPYYYAGLALTSAAWADERLDKDANSEKVKILCDKADAIQKTSDIYEIRNMAASQQMLVDPQSRWTSYGQEAANAINKGLELNPSNPRLHYLQGMSIFGTPEQFGGGKAKAKPVFEKAVALFKAENPKPLYPSWGKQQAEEMIVKCQ